MKAIEAVGFSTMNNLVHETEYRGVDIVEALANTQIVLCGVGAVGSLLADNLVRQGFRRLRVIDHDRVEPHNINTQLYGLTDVGTRKAESLRNQLFRAVQVEVQAVAQELTERNANKLLRGADVVVDAFDNAASRQLVQDRCRAKGFTCLHVGLSAGYCEVVWDEQYDVPRDAEEDVCEYALARNTVVLASAIASEELVRYVATGEQRNLTATLDDFHIRQLAPSRG